MLKKWNGPGIFVTSAVSRAGKTSVAGAIARAVRQQRMEVGVLKPVDTHCASRREGLVSEDAEVLAHLADASLPLDVICPVRSRGGLPRALTGAMIDWELVQRSLELMRPRVDVLVVEGYGAMMTPVDSRSTSLDVAKWLALPLVITVRPGEEALMQMLTCVEIARASRLEIAGIVINGYDPEKSSAADEKMLTVIERRTRCRLLAVLPDEPVIPTPGQGIIDASEKVDWAMIAGADREKE